MRGAKLAVSENEDEDKDEEDDEWSCRLDHCFSLKSPGTRRIIIADQLVFHNIKTDYVDVSYGKPCNGLFFAGHMRYTYIGGTNNTTP